MVRQQQADTRVVNIAGRQRMLSQKMTKYALMVKTGDETAREGLKSTSTLFDQSLRGLTDGDVETGLPPASVEMQDVLAAMQHAWDPFYSAVQVIIANQVDTPAFADALAYVEANNETILAKANDVTQGFQLESEQKTKRLVSFLYIMVGLSVLIFAVSIFILLRIIRPLLEMIKTAEHITQTDLPALTAVATAIANGDLTRSVAVQTQPVTHRSEDEVGALAHAVNQMIVRLQETGAAFSQMTVELGNLTREITDAANNMSAESLELSDAAFQSGQVVAQVAETVQEVTESTIQQTDDTQQATTIVEQLTRAIDDVAKGAQEQAVAVARSAEVTRQIGNAIEQVAANAQKSAAGATKAAQTASVGAETVGDAIQGIEGIKTASESLVQKIEEAGERSEQIGVIVETIDEIAAQTNLLALNAAIEAARAGEHGKGFAVVADEVRRLAEKAAAATGEITALVRGIQNTVGEAKQAMDQGTEAIETGMTGAHKAGQALDDILRAVEGMTRQAENIAAAAQQINASAGELVGSIEGVSAVVEENTAATEEMAASSAEVMDAIENVASATKQDSAAMEEVNAATVEVNTQTQRVAASVQTLSEMANTLSSLVARFKLDEAQDIVQQIDLYKSAHLRWVDRLRTMLAGYITIQVEEVASHTDCALGKWYYSQGKAEFDGNSEFAAIEAPHIQIHKAIQDAITAHNRGDSQAADAGFNAVKRYSAEIVAALDRLKHKVVG